MVTLYATPVTRPMKPARGFSFQVRRVHEREAETPPSPLYSCPFSTWRARHERARISRQRYCSPFSFPLLSLSLSHPVSTNRSSRPRSLRLSLWINSIRTVRRSLTIVRPCVRNNFFASARLPHSLSSIAAITHTVAPPRVITLLYAVVLLLPLFDPLSHSLRSVTIAISR